MAHISNIGAGIFSDITVASAEVTDLSLFNTEAEFVAVFSGIKVLDTDFVRIPNIRTFPSIGTPANIVKVAEYGSKISKQVQGQADAPNLELAINYVPSVWASTSLLGGMVGDGKMHAFRFTLLNSELDGANDSQSDATGIGAVANTEYYWVGKIEALVASPQLTDSNTATITLSTQTDFYGAFTV